MADRVGPYRLDEELGRGSMGVVYRGFDENIERVVAVKIIRPQQHAAPEDEAEARLRFKREAAAVGKLFHPNIVVVYHFGEANGELFICMEFVAGISLQRALIPGSPMDTHTALSILTQIADALDHAHSQGVIHRDIKPANILVGVDGRVKITDFGVARIASHTITQTGMTMGTPLYMAPEQILGAKVDGKADQFSLAVIAYRMLSGSLPFNAEPVQALMYQILNSGPPRLDSINSHLPPACAEAIHRALAKKPGERYVTCSAFIRELKDSLAEPKPVPPPAKNESTHRTLKRYRRTILAAAAALLAVAVAAGGVWIYLPKAKNAAGPPAVDAPVAATKKVAPPPSQEPATQPASGARAAASDTAPPAAKTALPELRGPSPNAKEPATGTAAGNSPPPNKTASPASPAPQPRARMDPAETKAAGEIATLRGPSPNTKEPTTRTAAGNSPPPNKTASPATPIPQPGARMDLAETKAAGDIATEKLRPPHRAGDTKVNPKDGLTYVWIPPGTFIMGWSPDDIAGYDNEKPAHPVTLSKEFWIGQTPVTQEAYERVTNRNPSQFKGQRLPVETLNWNEARSYCSAVNMRLPTEAEWEYAARAGSAASRYGPIDSIAWYNGNSGNKTHEVAQKQKNAWGLYDMLGNVWQWVADWYGDKYYTPAAASDPQGPPDGTYRVLRGGSWDVSPWFARASYRYRNVSEGRYDDIGFRCAGE
jgi:formylglycine-generating enzyme required for sulfatase activity/serine/threonine protein kinase